MLGLTGLSLLVWIILVTSRDGFWKTDQRLPDVGDFFQTHPAPPIVVVIPARNEAEMLPQSLRSLLKQTYPGKFSIVIVDDHSSDNTFQVARDLSQDTDMDVVLVRGETLPEGWTGKLWALEQGLRVAATLEPEYVLLTDADIFHGSTSLTTLVHQAVAQHCDLVSLMVRLRTKSFWERALIPAFVFFFAKLYPFRAVNNPNRSIGAAAGGCSLIRWAALEKIGGLASIRGALIDDCTLGQALKRNGNIWLGLTTDTLSLRPYDSLASIWAMVSRSAYAQLNYSPLLLVGTVFGMAVVYGMPIVGLGFGWMQRDVWVFAMALLSYGLMTWAYLPIVRFYQQPSWMSLGLPGVAVLYLLMTLDSARQSMQGKGGAWKGRVYPNHATKE
jgi:hopene-associated glycosyltransferase HpnB